MFGFAVANNLIVALGATTIASYLLVVHRLRWRRYDDIHAKFESKFKEGKLTPRDAQEIMHASAFYDMPTLMTYSLSFALFKTYAIVSLVFWQVGNILTIAYSPAYQRYLPGHESLRTRQQCQGAMRMYAYFCFER